MTLHLSAWKTCGTDGPGLTVLDIGDPQPVRQTRLIDPEVGSDLLQSRALLAAPDEVNRVGPEPTRYTTYS